MADDEDDNPWFPLIGDMNPMTMPFGGFTFARDMVGRGVNQVKAGIEWVIDQGQDSLPTFPVEAIAIQVRDDNTTGLLLNVWRQFSGASKKPPQNVVCYIPEFHAWIPMWKSKILFDEEDEGRRKLFNNNILGYIAGGGGLFTIHVDSPEMEGVKITAGDKLLVDYQDRKNLTGGRVLKVLEVNDGNFLPAEWNSPLNNRAPPANPKNAIDNGNPSPLGDFINPPVPPGSTLVIEPATYDNEKLDPNVPPRYRPFLHPLNGRGHIASAAPIRNSGTGKHGGVDIGGLGDPIYAMADGFCTRSTRATGELIKKYVENKHFKYLTDKDRESLGTDTKGKYVLRDSGMSNQAGWYCTIVHADKATVPRDSRGKVQKGSSQGFYASYVGGYGTRYLHQREQPLIKVGQEVKKGQIIGYVGGTPFFHPHLHLDIVYKGLYVDPTPYMFMDVDAIAMMEYEGAGTTRQNQGSNWGYLTKSRNFSSYEGETHKSGKPKNPASYTYRIGSFILGQQLRWPKQIKNPNNPGSAYQWYMPVSGNPLTTDQLTNVVKQLEPSATGNTDNKDTANEQTSDYSNSPNQPRPASGHRSGGK